LASLSRNDHLVNTLRSVFERLNLNRRIVGYWPGTGNRGAAGVREHELLLDAIRHGRSADAQAILLAHIQEAWVHFEAHLLKIKVA
jgi:DNA-binding GntR family transcriptional regulator